MKKISLGFGFLFVLTMATAEAAPQKARVICDPWAALEAAGVSLDREDEDIQIQNIWRAFSSCKEEEVWIDLQTPFDGLVENNKKASLPELLAFLALTPSNEREWITRSAIVVLIPIWEDYKGNPAWRLYPVIQAGVLKFRPHGWGFDPDRSLIPVRK